MSRRKTLSVTNSEISTLINACREYIIETRNKACDETYAQSAGREMSDYQAAEQYRAERLKEKLEQM